MVFRYLRKITASGPVYVQISRNRLRVRDVDSSAEYAESTQVSVRDDGKAASIVNVGAKAAMDAATPGVTLRNGFDHPRVVIGDFAIAEKTLLFFLRQIVGNALIRPSPILILHVRDALDGGLSDLEERALRELGAGAGAREVHVWQGRDLSDEDIRNRVYEQF